MLRNAFLFCIGLLAFACGKDEPVDPCQNIVCENGGFCANGLCNCPEGYEGSDCSIQSTPSRIIIKEVTVTKFPATEEDGGGWDFLDGPDITFTISRGGQEVFKSNTFFEDAISGQEYTFTGLNIVINQPTETHQIILYDYDDGLTADDFMGGISFVPYSAFANVDFPTTMRFEGSSANTGWRFELEYQF